MNPVSLAPSGIPSAQLRVVTVSKTSEEAREARVRQLLAEHLDFIWRSLRRLGVPSADADDAAQEVFVVAARRLPQIEPGRERAFLFGTALRVASTRRRTARRHPEDPSGELSEERDSDLDPESQSDRAQARRVLDHALQSLPEEQRVVFVLYEIEELSAPAIAEMLELPVTTVNSRLRHARDAFQAYIKRFRAKEAFLSGTKRP